VSTAIYNMLDNIPVKATFHHADIIMVNEQNANGFVDDASLIMNVTLQPRSRDSADPYAIYGNIVLEGDMG
jgi:hypothetical protein